MIKKLAILTSGGDSPGMNQAVRVLAKYAISQNIQPFLVYEGFKGLVNNQIEKVTDVLTLDNHIFNGGTSIYSARFPEFKDLEVQKRAYKILNEQEIDALIVIGGDGSYQGAQKLHELGLKTIALPGTIDNDISSSDTTIGYDTALNTIVDSISKIRETMTSHNRVAIVEVMGHGCGDLALFSGLASGSEIIVTNELKWTEDELIKEVNNQFAKDKRAVIIVASEMVFNDINQLAKNIEKGTSHSTRAISLSHIQRGGTPSARENIDAGLMAIHAIDLIAANKSGLAVGILNNEVTGTPILQALSIPRISRKTLTKVVNKINQV